MHYKRGELGRRLTVRPLPAPFSQLLPKGAEIKAKDAGSGRYTPEKRKPVAKAQGTDQPDKNAPGRRKRRTPRTARRTRGRRGGWANKKEETERINKRRKNKRKEEST